MCIYTGFHLGGGGRGHCPQESTEIVPFARILSPCFYSTYNSEIRTFAPAHLSKFEYYPLNTTPFLNKTLHGSSCICICTYVRTYLQPFSLQLALFGLADSSVAPEGLQSSQRCDCLQNTRVKLHTYTYTCYNIVYYH